MKKTARRIGWLACMSACLSLCSPVFGAMGGVGREGDCVLEIFANAKEVERSPGKWTLDVPKDLAPILAAAGVKAGTPVRLAGGAVEGTLLKTETGWRSLELTIKVPPMPGAGQPVERLQVLPWKDFGAGLRQELLAVSKGRADACGAGLERVLEKIRTVFGGAGMVAGFPRTAYEREFRQLKQSFDTLAKVFIVRGWTVPATVKTRYQQVFGDAWPTAAVGRFWPAGDGAIDLLDVRRDGRDAAKETFFKDLPLRADAATGIRGLFPCGEAIAFRYKDARTKTRDGRSLSWRFSDEGIPVWFVLHEGAEGTTRDLGIRVENHGAVGVRATVELGRRNVTGTIPANGSVDLCLVLPPDVVPQFRAEPDPAQGGFAKDYRVSMRMADGKVVVDSARKEPPELILNNPEMMPVEVEVMARQPNGRFVRECTARLRPGEMGYGIPVAPHKALELRCHFKSAFHKDGKVAVDPMNCGDRNELVLHAELKGNPEVAVRNAGPVALRLSGMAGPAGEVSIPPGASATVTVPAGKRTLLTGTAVNADYRCEPVSVAAMEPGGKVSVQMRMALKEAPQVVLRNERGMMDVEATLMSAGGRALGKPIKVKRGATAKPVSLPSAPGLYFRLSYRYEQFEAEGRLDVPAVPRGGTKTLDIPNPGSDVRVQSSVSSRQPAAYPPPPRQTASSRPVK